MDKDKKIEEMKKDMLQAGVYSKEDIEKICELEKEYLKECEEISKQCIAEGYPSQGSNYELRCEDARKWYDDQIREIDKKYNINEDDEAETEVNIDIDIE